MMPATPAHLTRRLVAVAVISAAASAPPALADPTTPYPNIGAYKQVSSIQIFRIVSESGVWFTTPLGMRCAIDDDGGYGCSGQLAGVSAGENEVGWLAGDAFPRLYRTEQPRFSSGVRQTILPESSFLQYRGSRCAVTRESAAYCIHGDDPNSQVMVTTAMVLRGAGAAAES